MKYLILLALTGCLPDSPERHTYDCHATEACYDTVSTYDNRGCYTEQEARDEVQAWIWTCQNIVGVYGCGIWECADDCHPTGERCP